MNVLDKDIVRSVDAIDLVLGSVAKPIVEKIVSPIAGNGNLISGAIKIVGALAVTKYAGNNRLGKAAAIGMGLDGSEDLIVSVGKRANIAPADNVSGGVF